MSAPAVRVISRGALGASMVIIAMLAAAPFVIANVVSERRIDAAVIRASVIAAALREAWPAGISDAHVLIGPGNRPQVDETSTWRTGITAPLVNVPADPWRNAFLVNSGARGSIWVISAGPNGMIDTPFEAGAAPAGDDVGSRVR